MSGIETGPVKRFYGGYHDRIADKRYNSPYWLRKYLHRTIYDRTLRYVSARQTVLDAGCGEGVLSLLMAAKGAQVTGVDLSSENIEAARGRAGELNSNVDFVVGDAEALPFADNSFDLVVSSHVIEHLPDPLQGLREIHRVTRQLATIAMPTCLNLSAWTSLGGGGYYFLRKRSLLALPIGIIKTALALVRNAEGPNEGYAGHDELPHIFRFPWIIKGMLKQASLRIESYEADSLLVPYFAEYLPVLRPAQRLLDRSFQMPVARYLGMGCHVLCRKV